MNNPFEMIDERLNSIETLLKSLKDGLPSSSVIENEQPVTTKQLISFLGITEPTLIRWRIKKLIPHLKIGSRILYQKSAVLAALENKKRG
jgi:hypothetical protein